MRLELGKRKRKGDRSVAWHYATLWLYSKCNGKQFKGLRQRNGTVPGTFQKDLLDETDLLGRVKVETTNPRGRLCSTPINKSK